jgi:hypothetical protein
MPASGALVGELPQTITIPDAGNLSYFVFSYFKHHDSFPKNFTFLPLAEEFP